MIKGTIKNHSPQPMYPLDSLDLCICVFSQDLDMTVTTMAIASNLQVAKKYIARMAGGISRQCIQYKYSLT
jgi:hypothetical protein